jgi:hypothetical protein
MARQKPAKKVKKKSAGRPVIRRAAARRQAPVRPERGRATKKSAKKTASRAAKKAPSKPLRKGATVKAAARTAKPVRRPAPSAAKKKPVKAVKAVAKIPAKAKPQARLLTAVRKLATAAVAAGVSAAFTPKKKPNLDRPRKTVADVHGIPSSLDLDRRASSAKSGRAEMNDKLSKSNSGGAAITAGDVDADWQSAESVGDEAPGGDNPTPDQDRVDDIGKALGVNYEDNEELRGSDKITERDKHRWELDPASSDDWPHD